MTRGFALFLVLTVVLANAGVTCLYSGQGPTTQTSFSQVQSWNPAIQTVVSLLTLPLPTAGSADVRDVMSPFALGIVLTGLAVRVARQTAGARPDASSDGNDAATAPSHNPAASWLLCAAVGVIALSLLSAAVNRSFDLSWGWIVRFAAGAGWAVIIARSFSPKMARQVVLGLVAVAVISLLLSIAYRADRDLAHFLWPIGPITITSALAAVWAVMSGGLVATPGRSRGAWAMRVFVVIACVISLYALQQTGRRAPALGVVFAALVAAALLIRLRYPKRLTDLLIAAAIVLTIGMAAIYVGSQAKSRTTEKAGPVAYRLEYWRLSAGLIGESPILGTGPDTLIVHLTNLVAPLRAYSPHVYHGNIDPHAHNEWLQAAAELGLPAGLLYLALPIGVIACAVRRLYRRTVAGGGGTVDSPALPSEPSICVTIVALIAGIAAIMILDTASITLRGPIMPLWYWTMLGLLAGLCRSNRKPTDGDSHKKHPRGNDAQNASPRTSSPDAQLRDRLVALAFAVSAGACFTVSVTDVNRAIAETRNTIRLDTCRLERLWSDKTFPAKSRNAFLVLDAVRGQPERSGMEAARALWRELYLQMPGQLDSVPGYAEVLMQLGETAEARRVLEAGLSPRLDPFNVWTNCLYAQLLTDDPVGRLGCAQRALRSGAMDDMVKAMLVVTISQPAAMEALERELPLARRIAAGKPDQSAAEATVELLRISAFAKEQAGSTPQAVSDQQLAADFYRRLEEEQNPYRRRSDAVVDAFFNLARMVYLGDFADYRKAYAAVETAEKYAVLGCRHEAVAHPKPEEGFIGGEVILTEFPQKLRPLWRLSSFLHVLAGDERHLTERVLASLPPDQLTEANIRREFAHLYRQACEDLTKLPPVSRPGHYENVCDMARQFEASRGRRPAR